MGMTAGNLASVGGLFTITKNMHNMYTIFGLLAVLSFIFAVPSYLFITEPVILDEKEEKKKAKKSLCGQIKSLFKQTYKACKQDSALAIGLFALSISRNGAALQQVTFQQWIAGSSDRCGYDSRTLWQNQNLITNFMGLPFVFVTGRFVDIVSPKIMVPATLIFQTLLMLLYMMVDCPNDALGWACAVP